VCWNRSVETLTARKDDIEGLAVATDERIEAYLLYAAGGSTSAEATADRMAEAEVVSLRSFIEDGGARLKQLISQLRGRGIQSLRFPRVHPAEISREILETLGFHPAGGHRLYATKARSE
jgi:hypothetical protein